MKRKQKIIFLFCLFICAFLLFAYIEKRNKIDNYSIIKTSVQANDIVFNYNNEIVKVPITIKNIQKDDQMLSYNYTMHINDVSENVLATYNNSTIEIPFDSQGNATFSLLSNEEIVLHDMPIDVAYTLTQEPDNSYYVSVDKKYSNTFSGITTAQNIVTFTNTTTQDIINPDTYDCIYLILFLLLFSIILLYLLKMIKRRKYYALINNN